VTFLPRKIYEPGGLAYEFTGGKCNPLAPHLAGLMKEPRRGVREVPWSEILDSRRARQKEHLDRKRHFWHCEPRTLPCYVWTFFNRQMIPYHGWYCYVISRHFSIAVNFRGFHTELAESILRAVPLGFLPVTDRKVFDAWMERFAETYPRKHSIDNRKAGSLVGWMTARTRFTVQRPAYQELSTLGEATAA
jgi:hypothetical protein